MPVTKTATRALRESKAREKKNKVVKTKVKNVIKETKKTIVGKLEGDKKELTTKLQKTLDKAAKRNIIHPNKASRLKSRLAKKMNAMEENKKEEAPKAKAKAKKTTAKKKTTTKKK